ncbi:fibronectin type III domain protein [Flavobacterium araucananum]|uniref:Fibronectin type-III domain-containing protein n=1 Tax=Flavobacterium araucananum TaxID=946678 RepID=A0A227P2G5_9FLAO|nr:fibronectin type III domain-containing protein [Flavobacterium araucananum]OXG04160.1 hypothetical protein B0A64_16000 [Flavobacterium araucananum]PWK01269.1 fibronectin type III domain protein [Flavobacterium araucananum]
MKKLYQNLFFLIVLIWSLNTYAQLYPVQLTPIFNSPYSSKLSDYATSMDTKFRLLVNPTDIMLSYRQVRLKLIIQGSRFNIQSNDFIVGQRPVFITGGSFVTLTNADIGALFRLENLQGITAAQYANGLPEGMYNFCFELYDFVTNQKIAQKSCAGLYLMLNDPPLLNTPQKNEQIAASDFPNIMFTWTPRQMNATNVSYKFELKQILDPTLDPQFAFQMSPLLYEQTLFSTALMYNLSMPILIPGMRYAWRVKAISTTGLSENAVFKNNGYSKIYSFKYATNCAPPTFVLSQSQSPTSVKITWQGLPDHKKYHLQYKKQDVRNAQWFSTYTVNTQSLITNLEPGVTYQFRVGATCDPVREEDQSYTYSTINTFTTTTDNKGIAAYNCGIIPKIDLKNQTPLSNLIQSETFTAGDFPVTILELQGKGSYSGRGYIIVPYLADTKIAVEFKNITINTDYQLISGVVQTSYNPDWGNVVDVDDIVNDFKDLVNEIADLFDKANDLIKQKEAGTISQSDFDKEWGEKVITNLFETQEKYKELVKGEGYSEEIKKEIENLKVPLDDLASTNYTTIGAQTQKDLDKVKTSYDKVNKLISDKCEKDLTNVLAFLAIEKVNYLKLSFSEVSNNKATAQGSKEYQTSVYDEENGTLKITHYKDWNNGSNPKQNLFLIETKDAELNKQDIKFFWLSYAPNSVDGLKPAIDATIYIKDTEPKESEPGFCTKDIAIPKGVSTQAQFADVMEQMVFYSALGMGSVEALGGIKATECVTGFTLDAGFQMGINAIVKRYLNESFTTKQLMQEVSIPGAATSCATAALVNQCGTACAGASGFVVGFGDDVLNQLKSGKNLSEVEISQSTLNGIKQGILNIVVQKVVTFGISKFSAWRGKYTAKQVEEALEDLQVNPEKYGLSEYELANLVNRSTKKFGEIEYEILVYNDRIIWKSLNNKELATWENSARLYGGELEFDFNTAGAKGIGQKWTDEAFETFGDRVKSIKVEWKTDSRYPNGESLGYKQFNEAFDETGDEILAIKRTLFYQTMEKRGYGIIQDYSLLGKSVVVKLKKK